MTPRREVGPGGQGWHWAEKWGVVGVERREKQVVVLRLLNQLVTPRLSPWPEKREKELRPFLSIPFCEFGYLVLLELKNLVEMARQDRTTKENCLSF